MVIVGHVLILIVALAYRFVKDWIVNEKIRRNHNEWKLQSELDFLKSQINPHFLFNALNSLFSMALQSKDEKTAEGISKLAEMMRYIFDKSSYSAVTLGDEIKYIEDYIYMQLLRFGDKVTVQFQHTEEFTTQKVAPMLFIPFIENAFKYGVPVNGKSTIDISLTTDENSIFFSIANTVSDHLESIPSTKIGIENVRKRLAISYPDTHELRVMSSGDKFLVYLKLSLI
jgi:LytS/YehU family sensor histidine kinase